MWQGKCVLQLVHDEICMLMSYSIGMDAIEFALPNIVICLASGPSDKTLGPAVVCGLDTRYNMFV